MLKARRLRLVGLTVFLGGAVFVSTGCQLHPAPSPTPSSKPAPQATSLFIRNQTGFDVSVYAVPKPDDKPIWLSTVPVGASRSVPLEWGDLQANGGLVVRTQIVGSSKAWMSEPLIIDEGIVGILELQTANGLTTSGSVLRGVTTLAFAEAMWW